MVEGKGRETAREYVRPTGKRDADVTFRAAIRLYSLLFGYIRLFMAEAQKELKAGFGKEDLARRTRRWWKSASSKGRL